jgi:nucleoside-diphosphate-sugar epimerase
MRWQIKIGKGHPDKLTRVLGWKATVTLEGIIDRMIAFEKNK